MYHVSKCSCITSCSCALLKNKEGIYIEQIEEEEIIGKENMKGEKSLDKFADFRHCYACVCVYVCV